MGGITSDLHGRSSVAGLYAVGRVRLHGPARRQPARLQLALGVLRVRPPRGARGARRAARRPAARPRRRPTSRPRRHGRRATAMWRDAGLERDAEGLRRLLEDAHPLARLVAASALAREESRGAHARADFPATDPALDERHSVHRRGRAATPAVRQVDVSVRRLTSTQQSFRFGLHESAQVSRRRGRMNSGVHVGTASLEPNVRRFVHVPDQPLHLPGARGRDRRGPSTRATARATTSACCAPARRACTA